MNRIFVLPLALGALFALSSTHSAFAQSKDTAETNVVVEMENFVELEATPLVTLTPSLSDIITNNFIEEAGAITLKLRTNNATGALISAAIRFDDSPSDNKIAPSSFSLKGGSESGTLTTLGTDDTAIDDYTSQTTNLTDGEYSVPLDLRVSELQNYSAKGGIKTNYTNTIVFTAVAND